MPLYLWFLIILSFTTPPIMHSCLLNGSLQLHFSALAIMGMLLVLARLHHGLVLVMVLLTCALSESSQSYVVITSARVSSGGLHIQKRRRQRLGLRSIPVLLGGLDGSWLMAHLSPSFHDLDYMGITGLIGSQTTCWMSRYDMLLQSHP